MGRDERRTLEGETASIGKNQKKAEIPAPGRERPVLLWSGGWAAFLRWPPAGSWRALVWAGLKHPPEPFSMH